MLKHKTKLLAVLLIALLVSLFGCSDTPNLKDAVDEFGERCKRKVIAEFHYNSWSKGIVLKCNDYDLKKAI
jgi:hypothetical protein